MNEETKKSKLELITNLLKVTLWPLVVLIVIFVFWKPLKAMINNSETISVGNLTLKLKDEVPTPSIAVKKVVKELSGNALQELLFFGRDTTEYNGYEALSLIEEEKAIDELLHAGLIKVSKDHPDTTRIYFKTTQLGVESYDFYFELLNVFAKKIGEK
jgi:hypothetical protein